MKVRWNLAVVVVQRGASCASPSTYIQCACHCGVSGTWRGHTSAGRQRSITYVSDGGRASGRRRCDAPPAVQRAPRRAVDGALRARHLLGRRRVARRPARATTPAAGGGKGRGGSQPYSTSAAMSGRTRRPPGCRVRGAVDGEGGGGARRPRAASPRAAVRSSKRRRARRQKHTHRYFCFNSQPI